VRWLRCAMVACDVACDGVRWCAMWRAMVRNVACDGVRWRAMVRNVACDGVRCGVRWCAMWRAMVCDVACDGGSLEKQSWKICRLGSLTSTYTKLNDRRFF